jgi:hypothetical protein
MPRVFLNWIWLYKPQKPPLKKSLFISTECLFLQPVFQLSMSKIYVRSYGWMAVLIIHLYEESPRRIEHEPPTVFVFFPIRLGTADLIFADRWIDGDRTPTALQVTSAPAGPPYTQWDADRVCEFKWWSHHGWPTPRRRYLFLITKDTARLMMIPSHIHTFIHMLLFIFFIFWQISVWTR